MRRWSAATPSTAISRQRSAPITRARAYEEAAEKLRKGMMVLAREGSIAKDVAALAPLLTDLTWPSFAFCTDDRNPLEIAEEGHIDFAIRKAIRAGAPRARGLSGGELRGRARLRPVRSRPDRRRPARRHRAARRSRELRGQRGDLRRRAGRRRRRSRTARTSRRSATARSGGRRSPPSCSRCGPPARPAR